MNGVEYTLRPSFEAIMAFDEKCNMDVFEALNKVHEDKKLSMKCIAVSIWAGIKGGYEFQNISNQAPTLEKIGNECQKHGFSECMTFAIKFLTNSVASDDALKKLEGIESP